MLEPATDVWRGTEGACFPSGEDFRAYLAGLRFTDWLPQGICLHNTASPTLSQWQATTPSLDPVIDGMQRLKNLASYYRGLGWQGGPHLFVTDTLIWVFNPLTKHGTHSRCFNATHWGIEMVGDFNADPFNPAIRDLTVAAMGVMFAARGLDPHDLKFHKDCAVDNHDCPGKNVIRGEMISRTLDYMAGGDTNGHVVAAPAAPAAPAPLVSYEDAVKEVQQGFKDMGLYDGEIDGWPGTKTKAAVDDFRAKL